MIKTKFNVDQDLDYTKFDSLFEKAKQKENFKNNGIYIYGKPGVGKTTFINKFVENSRSNFELVNVSQWIKSHQSAWENGYEGIYAPSPSRLAQKQILILDDLGSEFIHKSTLPYIYNLLNERFEKSKQDNTLITIITSNYDLDKLEKNYSTKSDNITSSRIISRLKGLMNLNIEFEGIDKRYSNEVENKNFEYIDF
ncbi:AAA family ATPase [Spiroplasma floricola]|uniref:Primosomal protein DnaI n=1 Tax=Spiroplasma floricola 23-6 TaxID=1336749 RepID=A0A2K8SF29_9MOLU|nr:AAA family ATPase [Spiroplasma floricola]AUB32042.1 primosomal protein DnaI [Spiroplasma floricola 23-6]